MFGAVQSLFTQPLSQTGRHRFLYFGSLMNPELHVQVFGAVHMPFIQPSTQDGKHILVLLECFV